MLTLLRKLGILRYGTKSYKYTSGKDMPARALMDDVYDEDKDLVNKQDVEKVQNALKTSKGKKTLKWVVLGAAGFVGGIFLLGMIAGVLDSPEEDGVSSAQNPHVFTDNQTAKYTNENSGSSKYMVTPADEIHQVFEGIRQANFDEDINWFMKFYASDFPDRSGKRQKTLDTWNQYDFASLDFFVFSLNVDGSRAQASVGWEIALLENGSAKPRLIETSNEVELIKEGAQWQIVSLE